jgi:hypothetical protein
MKTWTYNTQTQTITEDSYGIALVSLTDEGGSDNFHKIGLIMAAAPTLINAIKSALRIRALWLPGNNIGKEHKSEAVALTSMMCKFEKVLADAGIDHVE